MNAIKLLIECKLPLVAKDHHWFNDALKLSEISSCKFKHGSIITFKNRPLGMGVNKEKSSNLKTFLRGKKIKYNAEAEKRRSRQETIHAEISSILISMRKCPELTLKNCTLYSARILKNGQPGNSFPCASCLQIIMHEEMNFVYFENGELVKVETKGLL